MSTQPLVLSLFPGIGLLDMAFELEGFCVVRGPDLLWGGDVRRFHVPAGRFDGVIGGPPCQFASRFRYINPHAGRHGNQIPEYERIVGEARPTWFLMENVPEAPTPNVQIHLVHNILLRDDWVGGETMRKRRFSFGTLDGRRLPVEVAALHTQNPLPSVTSASNDVPVKLLQGGKTKKRVSEGRGALTIAEMLRSQGLPEDFFGESPLTAAGKRKVIGNGVPLPMGRAIAKAVKRAMYGESDVAA